MLISRNTKEIQEEYSAGRARGEQTSLQAYDKDCRQLTSLRKE